MELKHLRIATESMISDETKRSCLSEDVVRICEDVRLEIQRQSAAQNEEKERTCKDGNGVAVSPCTSLPRETATSLGLNSSDKVMKEHLNIVKTERDMALRELFRVRKDYKAKISDMQKKSVIPITSSRTNDLEGLNLIPNLNNNKKLSMVDLQTDNDALQNRVEIAEGHIFKANIIETRLRNELDRLESKYVSVSKALEGVSVYCEEELKDMEVISPQNLAVRPDLELVRLEKKQGERERCTRRAGMQTCGIDGAIFKQGTPDGPSDCMSSFREQIKRMRDGKDKEIKSLSEKFTGKELECRHLRAKLQELSKDCDDALRNLGSSEVE